MLSKKNIIIAVVVLIVIIVVGLVVYFIFLRQPVEEKTNQNSSVSLLTNAPTSAEAIPGLETDTMNLEEAEIQGGLLIERKLKILASTFVERYGSYSDQGELQNLNELECQMTDSMKQVAQGYRLSLESDFEAYSNYYGVATKSLVANIKLLNQTEGLATVEIITQRIKKIAGQATEKFNQTALVTLEKVTDDWLIANVSWQ